MAQSITSSNALLFLTIPGIRSNGITFQLQEFAPDDILDLDSQKPNEVHLGVDGHMSYGHIFSLRKMTVHLAADSTGISVFDDWHIAEDVLGDTIVADGVLTFPGNKTSFVLHNGVLTGYRDVPNAKKELQPQTYEITWEKIIKITLGG